MTIHSLLPATAEQLDPILASHLASYRYVRGDLGLVIDADRTLAPVDSGRVVGGAFGLNDRIRHVFETLGYGEAAFMEVSTIWGEVDSAAYLRAVKEASGDIMLRPVWVQVLGASQGRVPVVVVSAGIPQVWRTVLDLAGFPEVLVVGGCHPAVDSFLACPETKAEIVSALQRRGRRVLAAGDSAIDLRMLQQAEVPIFVPDTKGSPGFRALLGQVPKVRHLLVDAQRFEDLPTCRVEDLLELVIEGRGPT